MFSPLTQLHFIRPRVNVRAKKDDFVAPTEAPGEGRRKPPSYDEDGEPKKAEVAHPIKKLIKKFFTFIYPFFFIKFCCLQNRK